MDTQEALPCRHRGAPPPDLVNHVIRFLDHDLALQQDILEQHGLSPEEYRHALPAAIEKWRGRNAASTGGRREFARSVISHVAATSSLVESYHAPTYGEGTIYRIALTSGEQIAIIQKGCPDGAHTARWTRPDWADELYLWWLCSSTSVAPGTHVWKGVGRLRRKVSSEPANQLDGIIFFDSICGSCERPCAKDRQTEIAGKLMPPPCIYVFPAWSDDEKPMNWRDDLTKIFPRVILETFGVSVEAAGSYTGFVGFNSVGTRVRTEVTSRFGPAKSTSARD